MFGWVLTGVMIGAVIVIVAVIRNTNVTEEEKTWIKEVRDNGMKVKNDFREDMAYKQNGTKEIFVASVDDYDEEEPMNQSMRPAVVVINVKQSESVVS